uniref:HAUS augmin-like complex subunit 3 N-terminal domain-containing protein n=1 Tax=Amphimedon queenslandica TaxID=400682 RepID=A0A1X7TCU9_AMPQE
MDSDFKSILSRLGYKGALPSLGAAAVNKRIESFIKLITQELKSCEALTGEAKENFEELVRLNKELSREDFRKVLRKRQDAKLKNQEKYELEAKELEERAQSLKEQLQTLNHIHRLMSLQNEKCLRELEAAGNDLKLLQNEHQEAALKSEEANTKFIQSLSNLKASMNRLIGLYSNQTSPQTRERKREGEREGSSCSLLSCTSLEPYYKAEEEFMKCLTDFAKKQFLPGMSKMTDLSDTADFGLKDEEELSQYLTKQEYDKQSEQLKRLQTIYPIVQTQLIRQEVNKSHFAATSKRTMEEIEEIKSGRGLVSLETEALSKFELILSSNSAVMSSKA